MCSEFCIFSSKIQKQEYHPPYIIVLPGHSCGSCNFAMDENLVPVFDDLHKLESSLPISVKEYLNLAEDGLVSGDCFLPFSVLVSHQFGLNVCCTFGVLPYFPENDNQVFGAGYRFGGGCPFFPKIGHQGLVLGTNLGWWCQHLWVHRKYSWYLVGQYPRQVPPANFSFLPNFVHFLKTKFLWGGVTAAIFILCLFQLYRFIVINYPSIPPQLYLSNGKRHISICLQYFGIGVCYSQV